MKTISRATAVSFLGASLLAVQAGRPAPNIDALAAEWQQWAEANHVLPLNPFKIPQQQ